MSNVEYEFSQGFFQSKFPVTSDTISFSDQGANFTWSVQSDVPVGFGHFPSDSNIDAFVPRTTATGNIELILRATSPGKSIFSRTNPVTANTDAHIEFFEVVGKWKVVFVATNTADPNFTTTLGTSALNSPTTPTFPFTSPFVVLSGSSPSPCGCSGFKTSFNASFNPIGKFSEIRFSTSASQISKFIEIDELNTTLSCFCAGTRFATRMGTTIVEELAVGDKILTAEGGETTVRWVGKQFIDPKLMHPSITNPICIRAGALGEGVPKRDLFLSQDHAIEIGVMLITAGALVNGQTIYQVPKMPT